MKSKNEMKLFAKRDVLTIMVLWNLLLTGALIFLFIIHNAGVDEFRNNDTVSSQVQEELRGKINDLEPVK